MTSHAMPQPSDEHRKLRRFVGTWAGAETLHPSEWGPGGPARGRQVMSAICDGFFVAQDYQEERDGQVVFRGHGVLGYDTRSQEYTWYWVDSMGMPPASASRGRWEGDTLTFRSQSGPVQSRYTHRFEGADALHFRIESSADGSSWQPVMEGSYRRQA